MRYTYLETWEFDRDEKHRHAISYGEYFQR